MNNTTPPQNPSASHHVAPPRRLTRRPKPEAEIAGVAGGLADYFGLDPTIVRVGFVVTALLNGAGILAYVILWAVVPVRDSIEAR